VKRKHFIFLVVIYSMISTCLCAQEHTDAVGMDAKKFRPYHRISIMMANAHIPRLLEEENKKTTIVAPAWGLDYDYWFNKRWAIGLHNDIILSQFKIEKSENGSEIERSFPITSNLVGLYKPTEHFVLIAGLGREFEKNEQFNMIDLGVEYGFEIPKEWEISINLNYENKFNAYDTWLFGIGISKKFSCNKIND